MDRPPPGQIVPGSAECAFEDTFHLCDADGDGYITHDEVLMLLRGLGQTPTEKDGAAFLEGLPHKVSLGDFTDHLNRYYRPPLPPERLLEAFRVLDPARTGVISGEKLKQLITSLGEGLTNSEVPPVVYCEMVIVGQVEGVFADIKLDEDGNVNYAELAELRPLRGRQGDNVILESQGWSEPEVTRHSEVRGGARKDRLASISTVATDPSMVHEPTEAESMALRKVMEIHDSHFPANGYVRYVPYLSSSIMDSAIVKRRASKEGTSAAPSRREATPNGLSSPSPARKTTDELLSQRTEELRLLTHEAAELLAENKELRGEIARLSDALRVALEKPGSGVALDDLHHCTREQNDVLDRQNHLLKEEVSKLQIAVSHLKEQQQDYSNRFNEADAKAQEFARLLARSEERRSIAETRLEELSAEAQTSEERRAQIERDAQGDRHQRKSLEDSIQNLREEFHQKAKALQDAEARARAAVDRVRAVEATNARRLSSLEGQVDDSKSRIAQLMGDLNIARTEAEGAHKIVKSLEKRRADTQFRLDDCKAELMETRDQLGELQTARDRATLQEQVLSEKLELEVRARKADVAEVKREAAEAVATEKETSRRKCADLETKLESADEVTASLRARICTLEEEVTSLRKANSVLSREIDRERDLRNKESDDLQSSRLALVSENDELDKRIRALRDELSLAQASLKTQEEVMVARSAEVAGENERLAKRCAKAEEDVVVTRKEIEALRIENSRLVEQLEKEVTHHRNAVERKEGEVQAAAHQNEAE
ncbi:hypothetical protein FOZ62_010396, partial [Perkinsus olseni]